MKALAEYIMVGPKQASIASLLLGFVPLVGPWLCSAAIALVVLQVGLREAAKVLPWALLPALFWFYLGDASFLMLLITVFGAAAVLRVQHSLSLALVSAVTLSAVLFALMVLVVPKSLDPLVNLLTQVFASSEEMKAAMSASEQVLPDADVSVADSGQVLASGIAVNSGIALLIQKIAYLAFAWGGAMTACLVMLLARWWQSVLYKPGAFQQEFHSLRLSLNLAIFVPLLMFTLMAVPDFGFAMSAMYSVPILLSGVALVHGLVKAAGMSVHWLGMFYLGLVLMGQFLYLPVLIVALLDAVFDFRTRVGSGKK